MSNPKVSIILTTHGSAPYLKQAIGSVLAQTFEDWECIFAIDGSPSDPRPSIFDNRFHACGVESSFNKAPCRFAKTINAAFKISKGEMITYLCHDDLYLPWRLEMMVHYLQPNIDVVFGHQRLLSCEQGFLSYPMDDRIGNPSQPAGTVDHSSVMHRRECFEKAGGWDENAPPRYGDAYFWMRLQAAGYKFHCIPEVLDMHRFNRESITWKEDHPAKETAKCQL